MPASSHPQTAPWRIDFVSVLAEVPADWDREQVIEAAERALRGASSPGLQFLKDLTVQDAEPADGDDEDAEYGGEA